MNAKNSRVPETLKTSLLVLLALLAAACSSNDSNDNTVAAEQHQATENKGAVIAVVEGREINETDFNAYLALIDATDIEPKQLAEVKKKFIEKEALVAKIEKTAVLDVDLLKAQMRETQKEFIIGRYFETFLDAKINDGTASTYANDDKVERKARAAHILIRMSEQASETEKNEALTKAQTIANQLNEGAPFEELALRYSEDKASANNGGSLNWLYPGAMGDKFSSALFALKAGEVSDPVTTEYGIHLIKVLEFEDLAIGRELDQETMQAQLRNTLMQQELQRLMAEIQLELKLEPKQ